MYFIKSSFILAFTFLFTIALQGQEWVSYQSQQQVNDLIETAEDLLLATDAGLVTVNKLTLEKKFGSFLI